MSNLLGLSFLEMIMIFMLIFQVRRFGQITSRMNIFRLSFIRCRCIEKSSEKFKKIRRRLIKPWNWQHSTFYVNFSNIRKPFWKSNFRRIRFIWYCKGDPECDKKNSLLFFILNNGSKWIENCVIEKGGKKKLKVLVVFNIFM